MKNACNFAFPVPWAYGQSPCRCAASAGVEPADWRNPGDESEKMMMKIQEDRFQVIQGVMALAGQTT
jgi:hypothetical protein